MREVVGELSGVGRWLNRWIGGWIGGWIGISNNQQKM